MRNLLNSILNKMDRKVGYRVMQSTLVNENVLAAEERMERDLNR